MITPDKKRHTPRIGEILLDYGLISKEQLVRALDKQVETGNHLGSVLEGLGYLDSDTLLSVLGKQYDRPFVNLYEVKVPPEILELLPFEQVKSHKVLPINKSDNTLSLAMVNPNDTMAIQNVEAAIGGTVKPHVVPNYQMDRAISAFEADGYGSITFEGEKLREEKKLIEEVVPNIYTLLKLVLDFKASELHLAAGASPSMRINEQFKRLSMPRISSALMRDFVSDLLTQDQVNEFESKNDMDFVKTLSDTGRFRINIYKQRNSISLSARRMLEDIPSVTELNLPVLVNDFAFKTRGIILISGAAGQGKATTIASIVDLINSTRSCNIVTFEDPLKYLHKHKKSNVNQREIGIDTVSVASGLKHVMRQGQDVIVIGDLNDTESITAALNAATSGCLVIAAINASNSVVALDRMLKIFPDNRQPQIRMQLADSLLLLLSQRLLPAKESDDKICAYEVLMNSSRISNLIRGGQITNIKQLMQGTSEDMSSIDQSIAKLCLEGKIEFDEGLKSSDNPVYYQEVIRRGKI